eukprot:GHVP01036777.1.p1 GENE.GHVP01036777.1~~GHVP01036777.1.p1  ORF type:complete len:805 (+),score=74.93 GHVP01036777.1:2-2416(+)
MSLQNQQEQEVNKRILDLFTLLTLEYNRDILSDFLSTSKLPSRLLSGENISTISIGETINTGDAMAAIDYTNPMTVIGSNETNAIDSTEKVKLSYSTLLLIINRIYYLSTISPLYTDQVVMYLISILERPDSKFTVFQRDNLYITISKVLLLILNKTNNLYLRSSIKDTLNDILKKQHILKENKKRNRINIDDEIDNKTNKKSNNNNNRNNIRNVISRLMEYPQSIVLGMAISSIILGTNKPTSTQSTDKLASELSPLLDIITSKILSESSINRSLILSIFLNKTFILKQYDNYIDKIIETFKNNPELLIDVIKDCSDINENIIIKDIKNNIEINPIGYISLIVNIIICFKNKYKLKDLFLEYCISNIKDIRNACTYVLKKNLQVDKATEIPSEVTPGDGTSPTRATQTTPPTKTSTIPSDDATASVLFQDELEELAIRGLHGGDIESISGISILLLKYSNRYLIEMSKYYSNININIRTQIHLYILQRFKNDININNSMINTIYKNINYDNYSFFRSIIYNFDKRNRELYDLIMFIYNKNDLYKNVISDKERDETYQGETSQGVVYRDPKLLTLVTDQINNYNIQEIISILFSFLVTVETQTLDTLDTTLDTKTYRTNPTTTSTVNGTMVRPVMDTLSYIMKESEINLKEVVDVMLNEKIYYGEEHMSICMTTLIKVIDNRKIYEIFREYIINKEIISYLFMEILIVYLNNNNNMIKEINDIYNRIIRKYIFKNNKLWKSMIKLSNRLIPDCLNSLLCLKKDDIDKIIKYELELKKNITEYLIKQPAHIQKKYKRFMDGLLIN